MALMRKRATASSSLRDFRRGEIVAAAREIVAGSGLQALTIAALEKHLEFTRGVITYHFEDKDEIVDAVLSSALAEIEAASPPEAVEGETALDRVSTLLRSSVAAFLAHREAGIVLLTLRGSDPGARKANARLYDAYRERAMRILDRGDFPSVDAPGLAATLVALILGIASQACFDPDAIDAEAALTEATRCVVARLSGAPPRA